MKKITVFLYVVLPFLIEANSNHMYHTMEVIDDQLHNIETSVKSLGDAKLSDIKTAIKNLRNYIHDALKRFKNHVLKLEEPEESNGSSSGNQPDTYTKRVREERLKNSGKKFKFDSRERNRMREKIEEAKRGEIELENVINFLDKELEEEHDVAYEWANKKNK